MSKLNFHKFTSVPLFSLFLCSSPNRKKPYGILLGSELSPAYLLCDHIGTKKEATNLMQKMKRDFFHNSEFNTQCRLLREIIGASNWKIIP